MRTSQDDKSKEKGKKKIKFIQIHQNSRGTVPKRINGYVPRPKYGYKISILLESIWELSRETILAILLFLLFLLFASIITYFGLWLHAIAILSIISIGSEFVDPVREYYTKVRNLYYKKLREKRN